MKNNIFKYTVLIAIISVSTFLLTLLVKIVLVGGIDLLSAFTSNSSRSDFDIGDFYESVRLEYSKTKPSQTDIFVIPSDTMSREDITAILLSIKNNLISYNFSCNAGGSISRILSKIAIYNSFL